MATVLEVRDLSTYFFTFGGPIHALEKVSFSLEQGEVLGLVGVAGSGKSVLADSLVNVLKPPGKIVQGEVIFEGEDLLTKSEDEMRSIRGRRIAMIFQDAMACFSHLHTIGDQVSEGLFLHRDVSKKEGRELTESMLDLVGFPNPSEAMGLYPFELSGGLRQRAMIAMALVCRPSLLIADEPTTALDVSVQAQILKLIRDIREELGLSVLIITHDLGVVANIADEVVVVHQGEIMESGPIGEIFNDATHPYLKALFSVVPEFGMRGIQRLRPVGEIDHRLGPLISDREPWPETANDGVPMLQVKNVSKTFQTRKGRFLRYAG